MKKTILLGLGLGLTFSLAALAQTQVAAPATPATQNIKPQATNAATPPVVTAQNTTSSPSTTTMPTNNGANPQQMPGAAPSPTPASPGSTPTTTSTPPGTSPSTQTAPSTTTANQTTSVNSHFTPEQTTAIQQIVHDYLVKNPEVLVEASQALQEKEMSKAQQNATSSISQNKDKLFNDPNSPVMGNPQGNVTVVEFLDYQCGHCKNMGAVIDKLIQQNNNVRVIIKELPIFGATSEFAAKAAIASAKQNKFAAFHLALLNQDSALSKQSILSLAKSVGLDVNKLKKDMNSPAIAQQVRDNFQLAQSIRLMGTPAFILANSDLSQFKYIPGATTLNDLQQQLSALNGGGTTQQPNTGNSMPAQPQNNSNTTQNSGQN